MRLVKIMGGKTSLNVYQWPLIGKPEADQILVELFDYTCSHCRRMHEHLKVAHERFGDQVAFVSLPMPLNAACNDTVTVTHHQHQYACELAKLAMAVWKVSPRKFPEFHDWLFDSLSPRQPGEAHAKAIELVGVEALQKELNGPSVKKYIGLHVNIYKRAGRGTVPKLMSSSFTIKGNTNSADELCRILEQRLGVRPMAQ
jgi:protein-disulfide isomerase